MHAFFKYRKTEILQPNVIQYVTLVLIEVHVIQTNIGRLIRSIHRRRIQISLF